MSPASFPDRLWFPLAASVGLSLFPWGKYALYPFKLFTTWVHECCHAVMAILVGGKVRRITLSADTSGLTHYQIPKSRIRQALVTSSGYLGSCAVGCALYSLSLSRFSQDAHLVELGLGACMLLTALFWIRGIFGLFAVAVIGSAMIALGRLGPRPGTEILFSFLAIQTGLNALLDIRVLFSLDGEATSDARTMQGLFFLPAWFWALLWLGASLAAVFWTISRA